MFFNRGGRHYHFAKYLQDKGYHVTVFCANTLHGSNKFVDTGNSIYTMDDVDDIRFVFIRSMKYSGNGIDRILNMYSFSRNLRKFAEENWDLIGCPDLILASSVHLWTLSAGLKTARKFGIPCVCEVRDFWPESLVDYGKLRSKSLITKYLYLKERRIYERSAQLIFTWEGAPQYLMDKGWDLGSGGRINLADINYINNGVDLHAFDENAAKHKGFLSELFSQEKDNFIYTGAIRSVNNLELFVRPFSEALKEGLRARLIVVGEGDQVKRLKEKYSSQETDIIFTGQVGKEYIPALLEQADISVLCSSQVPLNRYGISQNKLFDYMAAGKPILSLVPSSYDPVEKFGLGLYARDQSVEMVKKAIMQMSAVPLIDRNRMGKAAREAVKEFDFPVLTEKLIAVIERAGRGDGK
ncbi:MAG: glycosyltransferase family 4 protein [Saccharofermentanales bacterium]|jgi:glycosyltransferase involved in cell wall biosynthesis